VERSGAAAAAAAAAAAHRTPNPPLYVSLVVGSFDHELARRHNDLIGEESDSRSDARILVQKFLELRSSDSNAIAKPFERTFAEIA